MWHFGALGLRDSKDQGKKRRDSRVQSSCPVPHLQLGIGESTDRLKAQPKVAQPADTRAQPTECGGGCHAQRAVSGSLGWGCWALQCRQARGISRDKAFGENHLSLTKHV